MANLMQPPKQGGQRWRSARRNGHRVDLERPPPSSPILTHNTRLLASDYIHLSDPNDAGPSSSSLQCVVFPPTLPTLRVLSTFHSTCSNSGVHRKCHTTGLTIVLGAGLVALSSLPGASAAKVCTKTESTGEEVCRDTLPKQAKIAIALVTVTVIFLLLAVFFFVRRSRAKSAQAARETSIDESQMTGPATVLARDLQPRVGALHLRDRERRGDDEPGDTPDRRGAPDAVPCPMSRRAQGQLPSRRQAPAHRSTFSNGHPYPFSGNGNAMGSPSGNPPKSAFVHSGGFPRPLLAGRLKDRIRERPPSASSLTQEFSHPSDLSK
ncbi:hypothetical protein FA13DRAFT_1714258 [Coprinellus micaceus]|uniref:Uncharacterized protein n=1 Tax=Coprinellus micaceus TaxID=71717 RepID=A0A4Y7STC0_COPMI|nr:hypothetical protein FA13DRAFT_1714258 [Coprinellus micaceus]